MRIKFSAPIILLFMNSPTLATAGEFTLTAGAYTAGAGGSNPVSFTSLGEYGIIYTNTAKDREFIFSLVPGVGYGAYFQPSKDTHFALGGVLGVSGGLFLGPYMRAGYDFWCPWKICFSVEFASALSFYSVSGVVPANSSFSLGVRL